MEHQNIKLIFFIISVIFCQCVNNQNNDDSLRLVQQSHRSSKIEGQQFVAINEDLKDIEEVHRVLENILIERVPGSKNHEFVRNYINNRMEQLGWTVENSEFFDDTPNIPKMKFTNIIARLNPNANRYLTLACHYDSKIMEDFVGATDSAVPCAIMINLAHTLAKYLEERKNTDLSMQFIFFDGEEAFVEWDRDDSIYGARHLARKWQRERELRKIDVMVLLDLLGAPNPLFYSYFTESNNLFNQLVNAESRLGASGFLNDAPQSNAVPKKKNQGYFQPYSVRARIEDDHLPFLERGVRVIHLIPMPFPEVWHTKSDNINAIDFPTVVNLNKIIGIFCLEYLQLGN